tara:strand:+ start:358 stop:657 length:300 start_codon:yes stop_codon:yes gene_type:complete
MTTITNTEMLNNIIVILENMKLDKEIDNRDDIKKIVTNTISRVTKGSKKRAISQKKETSNPYVDYINATMPQLKDVPKNEKLKVIRQMWSIHKAFISLN